MAGTRARRTKGPPPRLNLEEMEHDPSMRGMLSFLEISPTEKLEMLRRRSEVDAATVIPFPAVPAPEASAPTPGAPDVNTPEVVAKPEGGAPNIGAPEVETPTLITQPNVSAPSAGAPRFGTPTLDASTSAAPSLEPPDPLAATAPALDAPHLGAPALDASKFGAPDLDNIAIYRPLRPKSRPANTAQDGHTHGEQALFATLWRLARPAGPTGLRAIRIGERTLAAEVPMAYSTVQENLRALASKLAIDIRLNGPQRPKTYLIYPDEEVLRRRRAAGLTHVIRRTSGVWLVQPDSA